MKFTADTVIALVHLIHSLRPSHYYCPDDNWYSCPQAPEGCANDAKGTACNCGALEQNAEIDKRLKELGVV